MRRSWVRRSSCDRMAILLAARMEAALTITVTVAKTTRVRHFTFMKASACGLEQRLDLGRAAELDHPSGPHRVVAHGGRNRHQCHRDFLAADPDNIGLTVAQRHRTAEREAVVARLPFGAHQPTPVVWRDRDRRRAAAARPPEHDG